MVLCLLPSPILHAQTEIQMRLDGHIERFTASERDVLVLFEPGLSQAACLNALKEIPDIEPVDKSLLLPSPLGANVRSSRKDDPKAAQNLCRALMAQAAIRSAHPYLVYKDGVHMGLMPEIMVALKPGISETAALAAWKALGLNPLPYPYANKGTFLLGYEKGRFSGPIEACAAVQKTGMASTAEPNFLRRLRRMTNDAFYPNQWALQNTGSAAQGSGTAGCDINVLPAWNTTTGLSTIKIAVLDEGVDLTHPDLQANLLAGFDGTGQNSNGAPSNNDAHGTNCAGIVGAVRNNNLGISGIASSCKMIPVRIAYQDAQGNWVSTDAVISSSFNFSVNAGADVLTNSWGGGSPSSTITTAINNAVTTGRAGKGCVVCFAAGNNNAAVSYPGTLSNVICVGAMSMCYQRKSPSSCDGETNWGGNYGPELDVAAPGVSIYSTDISGAAGYIATDYYPYFNGTSSAAPHVAGVMGLILSANSNLYGLQARNILESTCRKVGTYAYATTSGYPNGTWHQEMGSGLIDAAAAVQAALGAATSYCTASGTSGSSPSITNLALGTGNIASPNNNGYTNYSATTGLIAVQGMAQTLTITTSGTGTATATVYVDLNSDFTFTSNELLANSTGSSNTFTFANFTIPATSSLGVLRMRVMVAAGSATLGACQTAFNGEVNDFGVSVNPNNITGGGTFTTCNTTFYDSGGPSGQYASGETITTTFLPSTSGASITATFTAFATESGYDFLAVYNGPNNSSPVLGTFSGNTIPGPFTSTHPSGALTFVFTSDGSVVANGWAATIACTTPTGPPTCATGTFPPSGATNTIINPTLTWVAPTGTNQATGYDVYFGPASAPPVLVSSNQPSLSYQPGTLSTNTTYCYTIIPRNSTGPATGCSSTCFTTNDTAFVAMTSSSLTSCNAISLDPGGTQNYDNNLNITQTLYPGSAGQYLQISFSSFALEANYDFLMIYDGVGTGGTPVGTYTGSTLPPTFTSTDPSGAITLVFTSDASVVTTGWMAQLTCVPSSTCTPPVVSASGPTTFCQGGSVILTSSYASGNTWSNGATTNSITVTTSGMYDVTYDNGAGCTSPSSGILVTVIPNLIPSVSISTPSTSLCSGANVQFTATPTNGGTAPAYQWKKNGTNVGTNSPTYSAANFNNNDVITCVLTSNAVCAAPTTATSNSIALNVSTTVTPSVSISTASNTACSGTTIAFTATPTNGGSTPVYQWKRNGTNVGTNSPTFTSNALANGDVITCVLTSTANCASPTAATSNSITVIVNPTVVPTVNITGTAMPICVGTSATFTATVQNAGTAPGYQWKLNGNNVGTGSASFTASNLNNNDVITCVLTSNANCASPSAATSNSITVSTSSPQTPSVSISTPSTTLCPGATATFTATAANGGSNAAYQWKVNGNNVGTNSATFTASNFNNNDVVTVVLTSSLSCLTTSTAASNAITLAVTSSAAAAITISTPTNTICAGASATFTATPANGGNNPTFQWRKNGINVGTNSNVFTTGGLANGDVITCILSSNASCVVNPNATSNAITMLVVPNVLPTIALSSNTTTLCAGEGVSITANIQNGGSNPSYAWTLNGQATPANGSVLNLAGPNNGDVVQCQLTSNATCALPTQASSNTITLTVLPTATPTVAISASTLVACAGSSITFIATSTNGGTAPQYQWLANGTAVGSGTTFSSSALSNGALITCVLTSNAACAVAPQATSNTLQVSILPAVTPSVSISATNNTICSGQSVTLNANVVNGGTATQYFWTQNGVAVGNNTPTLTVSNINNGDAFQCQIIGNAVCATTSTATSTLLSITVSPVIVPQISISTSTPVVCQGLPIVLEAAIQNGGSTPTYSWKSNGQTIGNNSSILLLANPNNGDVITCTLTSSLSCALPATLNSAPVTLQVNPLPQPLVTLTPPDVLSTTAFSAYQWLLNGVPMAGANAQSHQAAQNGLYSVLVSNTSGCSDTSAAVAVIQIGMESLAEQGLDVFPNPVEHSVYVRLTDAPEKAEQMILTNALGQVVMRQNMGYRTGSATLNLADVSSGMYTLSVIFENGNRLQRKVIKS